MAGAMAATTWREGMAAAVERALRERAYDVWSRAVRALFQTRERDADAEGGLRQSTRLWI